MFLDDESVEQYVSKKKFSSDTNKRKSFVTFVTLLGYTRRVFVTQNVTQNVTFVTFVTLYNCADKK